MKIVDHYQYWRLLCKSVRKTLCETREIISERDVYDGPRIGKPVYVMKDEHIIYYANNFADNFITNQDPAILKQVMAIILDSVDLNDLDLQKLKRLSDGDIKPELIVTETVRWVVTITVKGMFKKKEKKNE